MPKRKQSGRPSLTIITRSSRAAVAAAGGDSAMHTEIDLSQLPPMSPLTDASDLESELLDTRNSNHTALRAPSTRKRKAPLALHDSPPSKRLKKQTATTAGHGKRPRVSEPVNPIEHMNWKWNLTTLASRKYIFVRLDEQGIPAEHAESSGYWWPAKVIKPLPMSQIHVTLFGNDGHGRRTVSFKAGEGNTRLFTPRPFTKHNFASPHELLDRLARSWVNACKYLGKDEKGIRGNDDELLTPAPLPLPLPSLSPVSPAASLPGRRPKPFKVWTPALPDPSIAIPGEKVLTRMPRCDKSSPHWPAIVKSYIQPTKPVQMPRYELELFNGQIEVVERSYFFLRHETGYHTCKIGKFVSDTLYDDDDSDDDDDFSQRRIRSPTPPLELPTLPLPDDGGATFSGLSLRAQVALIEPILSAIINDAYPPAHERHLAFVKGRRARKQLSQTAGIRGGLLAGEPGRLNELILRWALRVENTNSSSRSDVNLVDTAAENAMEIVQDSLNPEAHKDNITSRAPVSDVPSLSDDPIHSSLSIRNSPTSGPAVSLPAESSALDSLNVGLNIETAASTGDSDVSMADALSVPTHYTETRSVDRLHESSDLALSVSSAQYEVPVPLPEFGPSSPTVLGGDLPPETSFLWPPPSLPASKPTATNSAFAHEAQIPPFSPQDDEASPSETLPAGELSSPGPRKSYSGSSHPLSPDSESAAETRVDEPSSSFQQASSTSKLRRTGCLSYEALSYVERNLYCLDVLYYEAVIQLSLWRSGKKTRPEPLSDEAAEEALHAEGLALAQQQDAAAYKWAWIDDIVRKREDKKRAAPIVRATHGGKSLRPVAKQISYLER